MYVAWETRLDGGKEGKTRCDDVKGEGKQRYTFRRAVVDSMYAGYPGDWLRASDHMSYVLYSKKWSVGGCVIPASWLPLAADECFTHSLWELCTSEYAFAYCIAQVKNGRKEGFSTGIVEPAFKVNILSNKRKRADRIRGFSLVQRCQIRMVQVCEKFIPAVA